MIEPRLVLASASPRRAAILTGLGVPFRVVPAHIDESMRPGEDGAALAERLAREKAQAVAARESLPVLAADTVVVNGTAVLGKPESEADARRMLRDLSGRTHEVVTAVCLVASGVVRGAVDRTAVTFGRLSDGEIDWYVATGEPMDKAGAYHVDGRAGLFITAVAGSPSNVAGLPIHVVYRLAGEASLKLSDSWP